MCDCQLGMSSLCFRIVHEIRISPGDRGYTIRVNMDSTQCLLSFFFVIPLMQKKSCTETDATADTNNYSAVSALGS